MTDEIRVTIAAQTAPLLLHCETECCPTLKTILVYPAAFVSNMRMKRPGGTVIQGEMVRLGE